MVVITVSIWEVTATLLLRLSVRRVRFARPHAQSAVRYVHRSAIHVIRAAAQGFWALAFSAFSDLYQKLFLDSRLNLTVRRVFRSAQLSLPGTADT